MSTQYKIIRDNDTKTFEDEQQFKQTVDLLESNNVDFETEEPDSCKEESLDAEVIDHTEEAKTDGSGESTTELVQSKDVEDVPDEPPERDISDDPIEWINRTAGDFVDNIQGTQAINKKGFRVLQFWYDINTDSEVVVGPEETDFEYCRVRATAEMPDGQKAVAHGSAHVGRGDDMELLLEMADTRAKSRALSDISGVGAVAVAELKQGENNE